MHFSWIFSRDLLALMLDSLPQPIIIAHRGASAYAPENTISAFDLAIEQGADLIELDVQLTADNEVVVIHDSRVNRTTDGEGYVKEHTLDYLNTLNASSAYGTGFRSEKIPTLKEIFNRFGHRTIFNIEMKNSYSPFSDLPLYVSHIINEYNMINYVLISSFNPIALYKISKYLPQLKVGLLLHNPFTIKLFSLISIYPFAYHTIHLPFFALSPSLIHSLKKRGKLIFSYTLNHPTDINTAIEYGVNGFFTDYPLLARKTLALIDELN